MRAAAIISRALIHSKSLTPFLFVFVATKGFVFLGFLFLGRAIEPNIYGTIELSLSLALVGATLLGLGLGGAATKMKLDLGVEPIADLFASRVVIASGIATVAGVASYLSGNMEAALGWILLPLAVSQLSYGILLKINQRRIPTAFTDTLLNSTVLIFSFAIIIQFGRLDIERLLIACALAAIIVTLTSVSILFSVRAQHLGARIKISLALGLPMLFGDLAGQVLTQGGRISLALTGIGLDAIGLYSAVFRVCAGLVLFHQVIWTVYYTPLYKLSAKSLDRAYAGICLGFSVLGFSLAVIIIAFSDLVFPQYIHRARTVGWLAPVVCAQVLQWIYLPMLLIRLQKAGIALQGGFLILIWLILMGGGLLIWNNFHTSGASFAVVMAAYLTCFVGANLSLCAALYRRGDKLKLTAILIGLGLCPIVMVSA